jgi:hypothetical protein
VTRWGSIFVKLAKKYHTSARRCDSDKMGSIFVKLAEEVGGLHENCKASARMDDFFCVVNMI